MPTYYPFFDPADLANVLIPAQQSPAGRIAINTTMVPVMGSPWLTVNGKVGINFDLTALYHADAAELNVRGKVRIGVETTLPGGPYDKEAPDLAVEGKVGIGYNFVNQTKSYAYAEAPALSVAGKAVIGADLRDDPYLSSNAPTLNVSGSVSIGEPPNYQLAPPERLKVRGAVNITDGDLNLVKGSGVGANLNVAGNTAIDGDTLIHSTLRVVSDATFGGRIYFTQNKSFTQGDVTDVLNLVPTEDWKIGTGNAGVFIDTTSPEQTFGSSKTRPDITYPVFAVVNGLMGHVQTKLALGAPPQDLEQVVKDALSDGTGFDGHYILMGDMKGLLKASQPALPDPYNDAYGMRMSWNSDFVMLTLAEIDQHDITITKKVGKKTVTTTETVHARRDSILSWGDKPDNYFRLRYVGEELSIFAKETNKKKPTKPSTNPKKKEKQEASLKAKYKLARDKLLKRALADPHGVPVDSKHYRDIVIVDPDGSVIVNGAIYALRALKTSDARLKEDVGPIGKAMDLALALRGVKFSWKTGEKGYDAGDQREYGMIAQEVEKLCPTAVSTDSEGLLAIDYDQIVPILLEAIKEQEHVIASQQSRLTRLEQTVGSLVEVSSSAERNRVTAAPKKRSPVRERPPAARSVPLRTDRAARGPRR